MMEPVAHTPPDLDILFDLFNEENFSDDIEDSEVAGSLCGESDNADDNTDDTSSESSGSSGNSSSISHSPPFQQISTYYPCPPSVAFVPNPLSSFTGVASQNHNSNKRVKTEDKDKVKRSKIEDKLLRNRESANKSRLKRKNEKYQLEETVAALREQVRTLEMQNTALLTDNTTLSQHNFFLQGLLKKQQLDNANEAASTDQSITMPLKTSVSAQNHMSTLSGISMLCVVFSVSFFNEWLPSAMQSGTGASGGDSWGLTSSSAGRVLLSVDDDDFSSSVLLPDYDRYDNDSLSPHSPRFSRIALHYVLILSSMLLYYCYHQYDSAVQKKSTLVLPS